MRILLVEDEAPLRETLAARLKRDGFAVDMAQDGEEGLYLGREVPFDCAIIDLGLPKLSGMDLVRALREEQKKFPIDPGPRRTPDFAVPQPVRGQHRWPGLRPNRETMYCDSYPMLYFWAIVSRNLLGESGRWQPCLKNCLQF